jgi:PilZ domain
MSAKMSRAVEQYAVAPRRENRIPMAVAIQISGSTRRPEIENTFTENVSSRGARILTQRAWRRNERVTIASLPSDFQSRARVAYCERLRETGFAIGLEFLEPSGHWVIDPPAASERTLNG